MFSGLGGSDSSSVDRNRRVWFGVGGLSLCAPEHYGGDRGGVLGVQWMCTYICASHRHVLYEWENYSVSRCRCGVGVVYGIVPL